MNGLTPANLKNCKAGFSDIPNHPLNNGNIMDEIKTIARRVLWNLKALSVGHINSNPGMAKKIDQQANDLQDSLDRNLITPEELISLIEHYKMTSLSLIELGQLRSYIKKE